MDKKELTKEHTFVLLAAGYGSRIAELTDRPKCLLEINGESLLSRHLRIWKELGAKKVHLVLGYKASEIKAAVETYTDQLEITFSENSDYQNLGNTYSLFLALKNTTGPLVIFDADLIYQKSILENFLNSSYPDQILIGDGSVEDIECAKALVDGQGYVRKTVDKRAVTPQELTQHSFAGEAMGVLQFSKSASQKLLKAASDFLEVSENRNKNWEHLMNEYLPEADTYGKIITQGQWIEIDTPFDYQEAQSLFENN